MKAINPKTQWEYDKLMEIFEYKGWVINGNMKPTDFNFFPENKENTCIQYWNYSDFGDIKSFKENWHEIISFQEFLELEGYIEVEDKDWSLMIIKDWNVSVEKEKTVEDLRNENNALKAQNKQYKKEKERVERKLKLENDEFSRIKWEEIEAKEEIARLRRLIVEKEKQKYWINNNQSKHDEFNY